LWGELGQPKGDGVGAVCRRGDQDSDVGTLGEDPRHLVLDVRRRLGPSEEPAIIVDENEDARQFTRVGPGALSSSEFAREEIE
jgi:hypothetical protein